MGATLLILVVASFFEIQTTAANPTGINWDFAPEGTRMTVNGKDYLFSHFDVKGYLGEAHSYCESQKMYVVSLETAAEYDALRQTIVDNFWYVPSFWTSGVNRRDWDSWVWSSSKKLFLDTAWSESGLQPDDYLTVNVCVALEQPDFLWFDHPMADCEWTLEKHFLCEAFD